MPRPQIRLVIQGGGVTSQAQQHRLTQNGQSHDYTYGQSKMVFRKHLSFSEHRPA